MPNNDEMLFTGALDDNRAPADKAKDYQAEEIVASFAPVDWKEKSMDEICKYPIRNQDGSGSCVAQTGALMLGVENQIEENRFVELSAKDIYTRRYNGGAGMVGNDAMQILKNFGATFENLMPSQNQTEEQINVVHRLPSDEEIAQVFKSGGYVSLPFDIEKIASIMESEGGNGAKKPIMMWFRFPYDEWQIDPKVTNSKSTLVHHSVTGVDYVLRGGKKKIVIQDSWGHHSSTLEGLRFIDQDFINSRMTFCVYLKDLNNKWRSEQPEPSPEPQPQPTPEPNKPSHKFGKVLLYGMRQDPDVIALQNILKYEELFPQSVASTGNYLSITAKAVLAWQKKHDVASLAELNALQGRRCGSKTIKTLNSLYG